MFEKPVSLFQFRQRSILKTMADVDPDTLLEWLQMGQGDERDMQLIALEQLCMLLLMSDNVDRCFET
jgi:E3 ubiquitin-protein ligase HECTD1